MCVSVYLLIRKCMFLLFYLFTHCISMSMLVFLTGRHGLRVNFRPEACAKLARSTLSLAGLLLIDSLLTYILAYLRGGLSTGTAWDSQCYKLDAELPHKLTKTSLKKQHEIYTLLQFPCAKPWAGLARNLRDAGFKLTQSSPQTHKLNLNEGFRTIPICIYIYNM
jgi:hypothetical protein